MKAGLNKKKIIEKAAELAEKNGLSGVSMKALADELGIKPPSLYKHFSGGLEELNKELMMRSKPH